MILKLVPKEPQRNLLKELELEREAHYQTAMKLMNILTVIESGLQGIADEIKEIVRG